MPLTKCGIVAPVLKIVPEHRWEGWEDTEAGGRKKVATEQNGNVVLAASLVGVPEARFSDLSSRWYVFHVGMF